VWRGTKAKRALVTLVIAVVAWGATAATAHSAATPRLEEGRHVFWDGPYVESGTVPTSELCDVSGPCWSYPIKLGYAPNGRFRVAIDWPSDGDSYQLQLLDPSGEVAAESSAGETGRWSHELFVARPAPGEWTVRVIGEDVTASSFRARARLERIPRPTNEPEPLLPNLQANPPWDLGFIAPVPQPTAAPVFAAPFDILGFHPLSCSVDEMVLNGAQRCLRFSVGPTNIGAGPYEARIDLGTASPDEEGHLSGPVIQRIYRKNGSFADRQAGSFVFHEAHGHVHVQDLLAYSVHRVVDSRTGRLEQVGRGAKASFCTLDLQIADFRRFLGDGPPAYPDASVCFRPPANDTTLVMGVSPGWSDIYTWNLPDQYVDWQEGGQGLYVVRVLVDGPNTIRESNEKDNSGYALIDVQGEHIRLVERGTGTSPWDPRKVVAPLR
jgi:hypothetical protein